MRERVEVSTATHGSARVLRVHGEIDMSNAAELAMALGTCGAGADEVIVDLERVQYLDSAGIRVLSDLIRHFAEEGRQLSFALPDHATCRRVIELTLPGIPIVDLGAERAVPPPDAGGADQR